MVLKDPGQILPSADFPFDDFFVGRDKTRLKQEFERIETERQNFSPCFQRSESELFQDKGGFPGGGIVGERLISHFEGGKKKGQAFVPILFFDDPAGEVAEFDFLSHDVSFAEQETQESGDLFPLAKQQAAIALIIFETAIE